MIVINNFIADFSKLIKQGEKQPWEIVQNLDLLIQEKIKTLDSNYSIDKGIAIHKTALIETNVNLKAPLIIGENCFIGANSYLRNGVFLTNNVKIGTGCEIKTSIIFEHSAIAHFNFIGDSIIGVAVNFEAGSVTANHYNERKNKNIFVIHKGIEINTEVRKFGSLIGDRAKIGANAVLSPGTLLDKESIVKRLELIEQIKE